MPPVRIEERGPVLVVAIDRPEVHNCVDGETAAALAAAWDRLRDDDRVRVGVLAGAGTEAFSTGADLKALGSLRELPGGWLGVSRRLDAGKPVVAAVSGWCLAGGLELALACDLRVAAENAVFGLPNRRFGVPLVDGGTQRLPRVVGLGRAMELILTGRTLDASQALRWGLVNEVVPTGEAVERAVEIATAIASFPQAGLLADRAAAYEGLGRPLAEGLAREAEIGRAVIEAPAFGEAATRFRERRR